MTPPRAPLGLRAAERLPIGLGRSAPTAALSLRTMLLAAGAMLAFSPGVVSAQEPPPGATSCSGCHASGPDAPLPIDHLSAEEIAAAMAAFRSGEREATVMNHIAAGFSDSESEAIARWIAREE